MAGLSAPTEMIAALFFVVFLFFPKKMCVQCCFDCDWKH